MTFGPSVVALPIGASDRVVFVTGAGVSAASGIPTYRDTGSGWQDTRLETISHASRYGNHLDELWQFWSRLRATMTAAEPNAAHRAIAELDVRLRSSGGSTLVATQNVDGLHQRAGSPSVVELHGSILRSRCVKANCSTPFCDDAAHDTAPACPSGRHRLRPDIVLFGEQLPRAALRTVVAALQACDWCIYVGTSGEVWPVSELVRTAHDAGARCVLVNAQPWRHPHPDFHETHLGPAETLLPQLLAAR